MATTLQGLTVEYMESYVTENILLRWIFCTPWDGSSTNWKRSDPIFAKMIEKFQDIFPREYTALVDKLNHKYKIPLYL